MVAFVGNTSSGNFYVSETDTTIHALPLPKADSGNNAIFPYISYNAANGAFEVVGTYNQQGFQNGNGDGSYHYLVGFDGTATKVSNSNYDSRSFAAFAYVPDVQASIF